MNQQLELRLSGSGGQGLITAGIILAEAALLDEKNAIQTQSYGPEARGGASKAEVIISDCAINFPKVTVPDMTISLTQVAADKYIKDTRKEGTIIIDSSIQLPSDFQVKNMFCLPILQTAKEDVGKSIVANIVTLGVINGLTKIVSAESLEIAVKQRIPKGTESLNMKALAVGYELAKTVS